jgi:hypothetical protein
VSAVSDRRRLAWRAGGYVLAALALAVTFVAYLRPDMLAAFATAVLLCF